MSRDSAPPQYCPSVNRTAIVATIRRQSNQQEGVPKLHKSTCYPGIAFRNWGAESVSGSGFSVGERSTPSRGVSLDLILFNAGNVGGERPCCPFVSHRKMSRQVHSQMVGCFCESVHMAQQLTLIPGLTLHATLLKGALGAHWRTERTRSWIVNMVRNLRPGPSSDVGTGSNPNCLSVPPVDGGRPARAFTAVIAMSISRKSCLELDREKESLVSGVLGTAGKKCEDLRGRPLGGCTLGSVSASRNSSEKESPSRRCAKGGMGEKSVKTEAQLGIAQGV
ncbi:hypothetical protein R1flu_022084 [Riccia fluitans]|uniref:Uncharacterized protein n=1 Tax=Riccia fluitans TaxID=41844 RepID=A0ABD1ZR69_9MARC